MNNQFMPPNYRAIDLFIKWIGRFDIRHARAWAKRYQADPEAATCEAMYWGVLTDCGVSVEPNADLDNRQKAPDFACHKDGNKFYVEVTCIRIDTATDKTSLKHIPTGGAQNYGPLNRVIYDEVKNKTTQCANLDAPCLLAVGTFHFQASALCFQKPHVESLLTGETSIACDINLQTGHAVGDPYESTNLKSAAFVKPSNLLGVEPARQPISALLLAGFGVSPPGVLGVIHPNPVREFDHRILDRIPFCGLFMDLRNATLTTNWTRDPECEELSRFIGRAVPADL